MPCSFSGHGCPAAGPPHDPTSAPDVSNSSTGGAGRQQSERGGVSVAPFSSSVSDFGRCTTHTWLRLSTATPAACPISQLLGSGFGQNGSTSNTGAPATEAETPFIDGAQPTSAVTSTSNVTPAATASPFRVIKDLPVGSLGPGDAGVKVGYPPRPWTLRPAAAATSRTSCIRSPISAVTKARG